MKYKDILKSQANHWLIYNRDTLLSNIGKYTHDCHWLDMVIPSMGIIWPYICDELKRISISGIISSEPGLLLNLRNDFEGILKPSFAINAVNNIEESITPVLNNYSECISYSNAAQMIGRRLKYYLSVYSTYASDPISGIVNLDNLCMQLDELSLIDFEGFFINRKLPISSYRMIKKKIENANYSDKKVLIPQEHLVDEFKTNFNPYISWEALGLESNSTSCFPIEIGVRAIPARANKNGIIYYIELGKLHGLPNNFPVIINGTKGEIVNVELNYSEIFIELRPESVITPAIATLAGGTPDNPIDIRDWDNNDLKVFLSQLPLCSVYLQSNDDTFVRC